MSCIQTPACDQPLDGLVVGVDPAKPLWMGEDWNVARHQYIEKQVFQAGGCNVMWWFDQDVARISQGKQMAGSQICHKTWHDVVISAGYQPERNAFPVEDLLQLLRWPGGSAGQNYGTNQEEYVAYRLRPIHHQPRKLWPSQARPKARQRHRRCQARDGSVDRSLSSEHPRAVM